MHGIEEKDVDTTRQILFVKTKRNLEILPPTNYALSLHNKRYYYHAKLWLQADHAIMNLENEPTQSIAWKLFCSACKES